MVLIPSYGAGAGPPSVIGQSSKVYGPCMTATLPSAQRAAKSGSHALVH